MAPPPLASLQNLSDVLQSGEYRRRFREFCAQSFALENLEFYEAIERYETLGTTAARSAQAKQIVKTYVSEDAAEQVNLIDAEMHDLVKASKSTSKCTPTLFAKAKLSVYELMQLNFFNRFKASEIALEALPGADKEENLMNRQIVTQYFADLYGDESTGGNEDKQRSTSMDQVLAAARKSRKMTAARAISVRQTFDPPRKLGSTTKPKPPRPPKTEDNRAAPVPPLPTETSVERRRRRSSSHHTKRKSKDGESRRSRRGIASPSRKKSVTFDANWPKKSLVVLQSGVPNTIEDITVFLQAFFVFYDKKRVDEVELLSMHFEGKGATLLARLEKRYKVSLVPQDESADLIMCRILFERLWLFYTQYDNSKLDRSKLSAIVEWSVEHSVGVLDEMLLRKYRAGLNIEVVQLEY